MYTQEQRYEWSTLQKAVLAGFVAALFGTAYFVGTQHWLTNDNQTFIAPIAVTATVPVALFLAAYGLSARFRNFVLAQDLRLLTAIHLWRVIGFVFLAAYSFGVLPGLFAWPAGVGDVLVGITAIFVVAKMDRDPDFVTTNGYLGFHFMGLADFVIAIGSAGLASGAFPGLVSNGLTSAAMDVWPLNIAPSFLVPAFIILHLAALFKVRHLRKTRAATRAAAPHAA